MHLSSEGKHRAMNMPQDFIDAINAAVREVDPEAGQITSGSMTLGSDFDEWLGPGSILKYGWDGLSDEAVAAFTAKFEEKRTEVKANVVAAAVQVAKQRKDAREQSD